MKRWVKISLFTVFVAPPAALALGVGLTACSRTELDNAVRSRDRASREYVSEIVYRTKHRSTDDITGIVARHLPKDLDGDGASSRGFRIYGNELYPRL